MRPISEVYVVTISHEGTISRNERQRLLNSYVKSLSTPIRKYGDAFFGHCQGHQALCDLSLAMST
jgi:hypothetical protein